MVLDSWVFFNEIYIKINFWSDWWCYLGVSNQTIDMITFNILILDGKSFFKIQKDHRLTYLWGSMALESWVFFMKYKLKSMFGVIGDASLVFPTKLFLCSPSIWLFLMENHFLISKKTKVSLTYEVQWHINYELIFMKYDLKSVFGVIGDASLVFPIKSLLCSPSICFWFMENYFMEFQITTDSLPYEVQWHFHYGWIFMKYNLKSVFGVIGDASLGVSNPAIVIFTFNMLLIDGKSNAFDWWKINF